MRWQWCNLRALIFCALLLVTGCGVAAPASPTLTRQVRLEQLATELDQAEQRWRAEGVDDYELAIHYFTFGFDIYPSVTVRDGQVVASSCRPGTMFGEPRPWQCDEYADDPAA